MQCQKTNKHDKKGFFTILKYGISIIEINIKDFKRSSFFMFKEEFKMLVRATDEFMKRGIKPKELKRIPKAGVEFEIEDSRYELLSGKNKYKVKFVEKVEEEVPEEVETTEEVETENEVETPEEETTTEEEVEEPAKEIKTRGKKKSEEDK